MKKTLLAVLAVFAAWSVMDFVIHGMILASAYTSSPQLWRPMPEMKMGLMHATVFIVAAVFVLIYARLISDKSVKTGVQYGLLCGVAAGSSMGYGSYSVMPIPYLVAFVWFIGSIIEYAVAGWITASILKK